MTPEDEAIALAIQWVTTYRDVPKTIQTILLKVVDEVQTLKIARDTAIVETETAQQLAKEYLLRAVKAEHDLETMKGGTTKPCPRCGSGRVRVIHELFGAGPRNYCDDCGALWAIQSAPIYTTNDKGDKS